MWQGKKIGRSGVPYGGWLRRLERGMQWLAIPNIAVLLVTLQVLGTLLVYADPVWQWRLALIPDQVRAGEIWRLITFLALPLSLQPIFVFFTLWFLYFVVNSIESEWGDFKTTLYTLTSILVTIGYSMVFDYPVGSISHFETSLFLAAAALFPEMEVNLFLVIPVKMKWLAWATGVFVLIELVRSDWLGRFFLIAIYSNFLLFFGPAVISRWKNWLRRRRFQRNMREG